jgi:hypothetical protein
MPWWPDGNRFVRMGSTVAFLLLATVALPDGAAAREDVRDAERFLRVEKRLRTVAGGTVWLSDTERTVRRCLVGLDDLKREIIRQQQRLDARVQQNLAAWETNQRRIAALQRALSSSETDPSDKRRIKQQIADLQAQAVAPGQLAGQADVRSGLIKLTNARHRLALRILNLRRLIPGIDDQYARLAADPDVQAAFRVLGPAHRLGPLSGSYRSDLRRLGDYESLVFTPWIPAYLQSGHIRVGAIVNERTPVTFTWRDSNDPTILTATMAEAVGLEPSGTKRQTIPITTDGGRRVSAVQATMPSLRFGQHVLRHVPCFVLAPEAEDLGAQVGLEAFSQYETRVEIEQLRLVIRSREQIPQE